jgi:predicted PurR-regulated permease PerM
MPVAAMDTEFTLTQKRALAIATAVAIAFGAYFLRGYFILVVVAAVAAYLFRPLFTRLNRRFGTGLSATLTLLAAMAAVVVPMSLFVFLAVVQITNMVERVAGPICRPSAIRRCASSTMCCIECRSST